MALEACVEEGMVLMEEDVRVESYIAFKLRVRRSRRALQVGRHECYKNHPISRPHVHGVTPCIRPWEGCRPRPPPPSSS